jgi:GT2 family glycosyltransferase
MFLDDDVRIGSGYIENVIDFFERNPEVIGYSGVTKESKPTSCSFPKKIFGLCSLPGQISRGGINNPVGPFTKPNLRECAWLIGCSNWRYEVIENLRFESDFYGSSLFEDVIFSHHATKLGKLVTNSELLLTHLQSSLERENSYLHSQKIIINRYRIFTRFPNEFHMFNFWVASFGFLLGNIVQCMFNPSKESLGKLAGTASGIRNLIRS